MSKKPAKPAKAEKPAPATAAGAEGEAPAKPKRSKVKLALFVLAPLLVLGGGGYAGWTFFLAPNPDAAHAAEGEAAHGEGSEAKAEGDHAPDGTDATHVSALPPEVAAETSFTYSFALAELGREKCGGVRAPALKAASEEEAKADGQLVSLSWIAANRRLGTITEKSCGYIVSEIRAADAKAAAKAAEKLAGEEGKGGKDKAKGGH